MARFGIFGRKFEVGAEDWWKVATLALAAVSFAHPQLAKPFVDTFAFGTSYGKVYAFAAYALLIAFSGGISKAAFGKKLAAHASAKLAIAMLAAVFLYGLFGQLYFISSIGGGMDAKYFAFDRLGYTSTHINHIHALKTVFCPFNPPAEEFDCARPMLRFLPQFYPYLGILLVLSAVGACVLFYPKLENNSDRLAYLILSFASLKTAVDGGILNYENLAFFMLVPFLLARRRKLLFTLAGVAVWLPFISATYEFYDPVRLSMPMLIFFYPACIALMKPKYLFPIAIISLVAPSYVLTYSDVVTQRWQPEACQNAGVSAQFSELVAAKVYTPCEAQAEYWCGKVAAADGTASYNGFSAQKPELLIAKGMAETCGGGVFSIAGTRGSIRIISRNGIQ